MNVEYYVAVYNKPAYKINYHKLDDHMLCEFSSMVCIICKIYENMCVKSRRWVEADVLCI